MPLALPERKAEAILADAFGFASLFEITVGRQKGGKLVSAVRKHPLVTFFVLAYALSWWIPLLTVFLGGSTGLNPFAPMIAALIVLGLTGGRAEIRELLSRTVRWRVDFRWYAAALGLPVLLSSVAVYLNVLFGATAPSAGELVGGLPTLLLAFPVILLLAGPLEEVGWRGYALPRMQAGRSALSASVILGALVAGWHLPLFLSGTESWWILVGLSASQILYAWIYNSTEGSVLLVILAHAVQNTVGGEFFSPMFSGEDSERMALLLGVAYGVAAVLVIFAAGPKHLSRRHRKQGEPLGIVQDPPKAGVRARGR